MATKKTAKKTTSKAPVATEKTTVTRVITEPAEKPASVALPKNIFNIVLAEMIGTFILTMVALTSAYFMLPLYVGLAFMVMTLAIGTISGAHINPAVTFGLWTMRKLKTILVPLYWAAQMIGAMAAIVIIGAISGSSQDGGFAVHFDQFMSFSWGVFFMELIGTAIFMFGIAAIISHKTLNDTAKALGIGIALTIGLVSASTLVPHIHNAAFAKFQKEQEAKAKEGKTEEEKKPGERAYPREVYITGATLNPAVALAVTESTDSQLTSGQPVAQKDEKMFSRFGIEVILATLIGATLGGNLFLLVNLRPRD